jgi:hypothetical protein
LFYGKTSKEVREFSSSLVLPFLEREEGHDKKTENKVVNFEKVKISTVGYF